MKYHEDKSGGKCFKNETNIANWLIKNSIFNIEEWGYKNTIQLSEFNFSDEIVVKTSFRCY